MKKSLLTVLIAVFAFTISHAQGISGNWKTSLEGPQGSLELSFTYKVDGTKLTGTVSSPMGSQEINNGKVTENELYYEIDMMGNVAKFTGKLDKDIIKLTMKMPEGGPGGPDGPGELKLSRVN
jgi:hypothetical protein